MAGSYSIDVSLANRKPPTPLVLAYYFCFLFAIYYFILTLYEIKNFLQKFVSISGSLFFFQVANIISNIFITCFMQPYIFFPLSDGRSVGLLLTNFHISFPTLASLLFFFLCSQLSTVVLGLLRLRRDLSCYACIRKCWARSTHTFLDVLHFVLPLTLSVSYNIGSAGQNVQMELIQQNYKQFEVVLKNKTHIYQFEPPHDLFCIALSSTLILTFFAIVFLNVEINSFLTMSKGKITDSAWGMHRNAFHLFQSFSLFLSFCIGFVFLRTYVHSVENPAGRWLVQIPLFFFAVYPVFCSFILLIFSYSMKLPRTERQLETADVRMDRLDGRDALNLVVP